MSSELKTKFDQLETDTRHLFEKLVDLTHEELGTPESDGKWSAGQVINHLMVSEKTSLDYLKKKFLGKDSLKDVGIGSNIRMMLFKWSQVSSLKFKAPRYVSNPSNDDSMDELRSNWRTLRSDFAEFLHQYPVELNKKGIMKHPFAGRINIGQTIDFFRYHLVHHQKQIDRIVHRLGKK